MQRPILALHHVRVKIRRTPHGLAGVVDDEIQPRIFRHHMLAKCLHARRVPQIEPENLQPMSPLLKIRFGGITHRRVARKPCGHDELRAAAEQLDAGLITDLHATAGEQRHAPAQVGQFAALAEIQLRACRTKLVVKMMDLRVILFADITILRLDDALAGIREHCFGTFGVSCG